MKRRHQPDARVLLVSISCLAARAAGLMGIEGGGRAWKAVAAWKNSPAGSRVAVVSSAGVALDVDGEADWPPQGPTGHQDGGCVGCPGQPDEIYAVSTNPAVTEGNLNWQAEPASGTGDAFWAGHSEVNNTDVALDFDMLSPAEARVITEQMRKVGNNGFFLGDNLDADATYESIQWTTRLFFLGLVGIIMGLILPACDYWDDRKPSGSSSNNLQGDTGSSPAVGSQSCNASEGSATAAAPPINQSDTPTGEDAAAVSQSSQPPSAGETLLTINRERSRPTPLERESLRLHRLGETVVQQKWKVIFMWAVLCLCHVPLAAQIRSIMSLNFSPTPQMPAYEADARFRKHFPSMAKGAEFCLVLQTKTHEARPLLAPHVEAHNGSDKDGESVAAGAPLCVPGPDGNCNAGDCCKFGQTCQACPLGFTERNVRAKFCGGKSGYRQCKVMGYAQIMDMPGLFPFSVALRRKLNTTGKLIEFASASTAKLDWGIDISSNFVGSAGNTAIIQFRIEDDTLSKQAREFAKRAHRVIDKLLVMYLPGVTFTGLLAVPEFVNDAIKSAEESFVIMDSITLPFATFLLWWVLRSYRLLVLLICTMAVSSSCCFGVLYLVGVTIAPVDTLTPELVMSILIAMNIDYALFLQTRFRSEVLDVADLSPRSAELQAVADEATVTMLATAGFTVVTSGTMLWLVFTSLIYFPLGAVKSIGYGCAVCLIFTIAVNVTLVPAMLSAFPNFFTGDFLKAGGAARNEQVSPFDGVWKQIAKKTTEFPNNLILAVSVLVLCSGIGLAAFRMQLHCAFVGTVPRGSNSAIAMQLLETDFGWGTSVPIEVLLEPAPKMTDGVLSEEFWNASQAILHDIQSRWPGGPGAMRIHSVSYVDNVTVPWQIADICLRKQQYGGSNVGNAYTRTASKGVAAAGKIARDETQKRSDTCRKLRFSRQKYINAEATATYAQLFPSVDPLGDRSSKNHMWLEKNRELAEHWHKETGVRVTFSGYVVGLEDIVANMWTMIPVEFLVIMSTVLILGVAFQSAIIPLRSIFTLVGTISMVYGSAVLVFQDGMLDFLGIPGINARLGAVNFMAPVILFPICSGICLDYDVFLITHIGEYRAAACSPNTAIQHGLRNTGGIITAAGLIMATAFSGHIAAQLEGMNSFGFFLVVTVLFDTFVMRPIFTPACMSLIGRYNWWPGPLFHIQEHRKSGQT